MEMTEPRAFTSTTGAVLVAAMASSCLLPTSGLGLDGAGGDAGGAGGAGGAPPLVGGSGEGGFGGLGGQGGAGDQGGAGGQGGAGQGGAGGQGGGPLGACGDAGLVACFRFDGDSLDGASASNHASAINVQYAPSPHGQALVHAPGSEVTIPSSPSFGLSAYTLEVWLRPNALPQSGRWSIIDAPGRWSAWLHPDAVRCRAVEGKPLPAGEWSHVACVHTGTQLTVFVNGVEAGSGADNLTPTAPDEPLHVGSDAPTGNDAFEGAIDELRLYDFARSAAEICAAAGRRDCTPR